MLITSQTVVGHQIQQFIAVVEAPLCIYQLQPVGIAIQGHAKVGLVVLDGLHQGFRVGGTHTLVDIQSIG